MRSEEPSTPVRDAIDCLCAYAWDRGGYDITRLTLPPARQAALGREEAALEPHIIYCGARPTPETIASRHRGEFTFNSATGSRIDIAAGSAHGG